MDGGSERPYASCMFQVPSIVLIIGAFLAVGLMNWPLWVGIIVAFVMLNIITLFLFRYDKKIAEVNETRKKTFTRVPEDVLLRMMKFGGTPGGIIGMYDPDNPHKTKKPSFQKDLWRIVAFQSIILLVALSVLLVLWATGTSQ